MSTNLSVTVNGRHVPIEECGWIERRPCGCIVSALVAVVGETVYATADQVHRHWHRTKRQRDQATREGLTIELITMQHYRERIGANWECSTHTPQPGSAS